MALTLVEASKIAMNRDEIIKATVMELYAKNSDLMQFMPFEDIAGNAITFNREKTLPTVAFRGVNEAYVEGTGQMDRITESLAIGGGDVDVDTFIVKTAGMDQRSVQEALKIKALSLSLTETFIKGSVISDPKSFDGFQTRITGTQSICAGSTAVTGAALSLVKLDELIDTVDDPTHLLMNKASRRRLTAAARTSTVGGYITYSVDAFGRRITQYNDLPILIADKDNTNADIMAFDETNAAGNAISTSIYCLSFAENGVMGLQNGSMDVRDLGEIDTQPVYRTRIEWYVTLSIMRPMAAARLHSINSGTATA